MMSEKHSIEGKIQTTQKTFEMLKNMFDGLST